MQVYEPFIVDDGGGHQRTYGNQQHTNQTAKCNCIVVAGDMFKHGFDAVFVHIYYIYTCRHIWTCYDIWVLMDGYQGCGVSKQSQQRAQTKHNLESIHYIDACCIFLCLYYIICLAFVELQLMLVLELSPVRGKVRVLHTMKNITQILNILNQNNS